MPQSDRSGRPEDQAAVNAITAMFGHEVLRKLGTKHGSPEDHLRSPLEGMLSEMAGRLGLTITAIGETRLPDLSVRPDYAIEVSGARVGYLELKRPGYGVPGTWKSPSQHDREQWTKLQLLPNVLYTDGETFARYNFGEIQGSIARLTPDLTTAGKKLRPVDSSFESVIGDFLLWEPDQPRSLGDLVHLVANLCRLLRDDVLVELEKESSSESDSHTFTTLATDWRRLLFPSLTDEKFADQYSQTVTFALLLARVEGVAFHGQSIIEIARLLGKKHSLMGRALTVLTDQPEEKHSLALVTMIRVLSVVDWSKFPHDSYEALYERFLEIYDPKLRRMSGVYYTPVSLVSFITRFVDDILQERLDRNLGFAEKDVIVVDPAMGSGSFLAEIVETVASTTAANEGPGAVAPQLRELSDRLIGFENQAAPYAIAELRIHSLLRRRHRAEVPTKERRFLADTLDDPNLQLLPIGHMYEVIEQSRLGANAVKREEPVMVVISNPPYVDNVKKGTFPWIEASATAADAPSIAAFRQSGNGKYEYVLANKYIYFWRWATWKAFDAHPAHPAGVIAFLCPSGFTTGPGFAGMRRYLRQTADEGWIIDLTPEGHQPPMATRFFLGNQQPICVAIFIRRGESNSSRPAEIHRMSVTGSVSQKLEKLRSLRIDGPEWTACTEEWCGPLQPSDHGNWNSMPSIKDLFPWSAPGVKPNRTWVYAPDPAVLRLRWQRITSAKQREKPQLFKESRDANLQRVPLPLAGHPRPAIPFARESGPCPDPVRIGYRAFDRQWVIPDSRLHHAPSPSLWRTASPRQIFAIEQHAHPISSGPALVFTSLIPDMDYHSGRGGRVFPLYRDSTAKTPNVAPRLLALLSELLGRDVTALDFFSYLAAVAGHPGYTLRFSSELQSPGVRVPLTRDLELWNDAVQVGQEVIWLHTYGERCANASKGRSHKCPKTKQSPPLVRESIPDTEISMPENIWYSAGDQTLHIGEGKISPVRQRVVDYRVGGMEVVKHWFDYRRKKPSGSHDSPLNQLVSKTWTSSMTTELLNLLNVLDRCVSVEPIQDRLLASIMNRPRITDMELTKLSVLPIPDTSRKPPSRAKGEGTLF